MLPGNRRSDRIAIDLPLKVIGADAEGRQFIAQACTISISRYGATIAIRQKLIPEQELLLLKMDTKEEAEVRVVGHIRQLSEGGDAYGVALLNPEKDLWHVEFPALMRPEEALASVVLECGRCHCQRVAHLSDVELEVFGAGQGLMLDCKVCANSTIWRQPSGEPPSELRGQHVEIRPQSKQSKPPRHPSQNERRHVRAQVNLPACIRHSDLEEVVTCEDASRGGIRLRGRKRYVEGVVAEIAMPYSATAGNIFVPARIVYCLELPDGSFRHGLNYIK